MRSLYGVIKNKIKGKIAPITHVKTTNPFVAITFDDGPDPVYTPILLKLFKQYQAHATFFVVGNAALNCRWLIDEIAHNGHEIGNHTMEHISMVSVDRRERWKQMRKCRETLSPFGRRYFRPPYGEQNGWSNLDAVLQGYYVIGWNVNVGDWCNTEFSSMAEDLLKKIDNGSIILFHDAIYDKGQPKHMSLAQRSNLNRNLTVDLVKMLLEECGNRFRFVTLTEMLKNGIAEREGVLK